MRIAGVIPARWGSTRFPGKSLALIAGQPLVLRVLARARQARTLTDLIVATDDPRIAAVVEAAGGNAVMTAPDHPSGTDRIAEALAGRHADVAINIQGDEPLVDPALIDAVAQTLAGDPAWDMATAAEPITNPADLANPSVVKVVWGAARQALYFSRAAIPFERDPKPWPPGAPPRHWRHVGIYGYQRRFLERLVKEPPCLLEEMEKLEQLRALSLGARMKVLPTAAGAPGVDTPADVATVEALLKEKGLA